MYHLRTSDSKDPEHLGRVAEVEIELTTLGELLRMFRHGVVSQLAPGDMTRGCGEDGIPIRVSEGMVRKWFDTVIFRVLRRFHCN